MTRVPIRAGSTVPGNAAAQTVNVLGIDIAAVDMEGALARIADALRHRRKGYVCLAGVHGVMEAHRDPDLSAVYAGSALTAPDGMPMVWVGRFYGQRKMERVTGPDLMLEILKRPEFADYTHCLCGGKPGIADELHDSLLTRFPSVRIAGTYTPPFHPFTAEEEQDFLLAMAAMKPDIIWVGISTPKQEQFMARYLDRVDATLMFGVGAAFDFHTGRIQDCAEWIKRAGLQWLHRLMQDPGRLWKRYLRNNPAFLWHILLQLTGMRSYEAGIRHHQPVSTAREKARLPVLGDSSLGPRKP